MVQILQSTVCCKRITIYFVSVVLACTCFSIHVLAQGQPNNDQTEKLRTLNAIQDANDHYYERRYADAKKAYQSLLKKELNQSQKDAMRLMLGQSHTKLGEDAEARRIFKDMIDEDPNGSHATQAVHQLTNLYRQRYQFREVILQCKQIVKQHPDTAVAAIAAYLIGYYQSVEGKFDESIASYKYFLENYPNSIYQTSAVTSLIRMYARNEQYVEAEKLIKERIKQNPTETILLEELATLYQQQGKNQEALELYKEALEKNPGNSSIRRKLGSLYAETGNKEKAIAEWEKLVSGQYDQYQQLGTIYLSHKMYPEAIKAYEQAIQVNSRYGYLYTQLAAVYQIQGKIEKAAGIYLDALQQIGTSSTQRKSIWDAMLEIYQGAQQEPLREKLILRYNKLHQTLPQDFNLALTLAELYFYAGQHEQALKTVTKSYQNNSTSVDIALERFADILERNYDPFAITVYKSLLQLSKDRRKLTNTRYKLAKLYHTTEQWDEAVNILKQLDPNNPASIESQLLLARIQLQGLHNPKAAQMTLQPLIAQKIISYQSVDAQLILGECHVLLKRYTLARRVLTAIANSSNKSKATARKLIGDSYFFAAEFDNALREYRQVIRISKLDQLTNDALERIILIQDNTDYFNLPLTDYANALQLYLNGKINEAVTQCEDTITLYPKSLIVDDVWMLLGTIYRSQNAVGDAIYSYRQIVSQDGPFAAEALTYIAQIYQKKGDYANALDTYGKLLTTYPNHSIVPHVRQQLDVITKLRDETESVSY